MFVFILASFLGFLNGVGVILFPILYADAKNIKFGSLDVREYYLCWNHVTKEFYEDIPKVTGTIYKILMSLFIPLAAICAFASFLYLKKAEKKETC